MSTATALKFQNDAKQLAAKRLQERKKGLLVLILRHLADFGYKDAYKRLETEAGVSLDQVMYASLAQLFCMQGFLRSVASCGCLCQQCTYLWCSFAAGGCCSKPESAVHLARL